MSKKNKLYSGDYAPLPLDNATLIGTLSSAPALTGVTPVGSQLLVETLTPQELTSSTIIIGGKAMPGAMQGYVRAAGPGVDLDNWGFKIGDRVLISGTGVMAPKYDECKRDRFFMAPHAVIAVLTEQQ